MPSTPTDPISPTSWSYAETFVGEDDVLAAARARAAEVGVEEGVGHLHIG